VPGARKELWHDPRRVRSRLELRNVSDGPSLREQRLPVAAMARWCVVSLVLACSSAPSGGSPDAAPSRWRIESSGITANLHGVWAQSGDIYAVGENGVILHSTGDGRWAAQTSGTAVELDAVWGSGPGDIYVVGAAGTILHSSGDGAWATQSGASTDNLHAVWGSGAGDVYAVGTAGTILHFHSSWTTEHAGPTSLSLSGVWGSGAGDVYAVGESLAGGGMVLHSAGDGSWAAQTVTQALSRIFGTASDVYAIDSQSIYRRQGDGSWMLLHHDSALVLYDGSASPLEVVGNVILSGSDWSPQWSGSQWLLSISGSYAVGLGGLILRGG
jgi:hypothetical protein